MMHAEAASLLGAVALRAASEMEQRRVRVHARSCAACRYEHGRYDVVVALLESTETNSDGPQAGYSDA